MQQMPLPPLCPLSHHWVSKAIVSRESGGVTPLPPAGQPRVSGERGIAEEGGKKGLEVSTVLTSMLQRENIWNLRHLCIVKRMDVPALAPAWPPPHNRIFSSCYYLDCPESLCAVTEVNLLFFFFFYLKGSSIETTKK